MKRHAAIAVALLLGCAGTASAQMWDAPTFFSPTPGEDIGLYVIDTEGGGDLGFMGIWRQSGNLNLGVRVGLAGDNVLLGSEFYGGLGALAGNSPLVFTWNLGFGATIGDGYTALRVPLGVSIGAPLTAGSLRVTPYVFPRVAFDLLAYDTPGGNEETETEFNVPVDIGADIELGPSFVLRIGATLVESEAFGVGVAYRFSRRLVVR